MSWTRLQGQLPLLHWLLLCGQTPGWFTHMCASCVGAHCMEACVWGTWVVACACGRHVCFCECAPCTHHMHVHCVSFMYTCTGVHRMCKVCACALFVCATCACVYHICACATCPCPACMWAHTMCTHVHTSCMYMYECAHAGYVPVYACVHVQERGSSLPGFALAFEAQV